VYPEYIILQNLLLEAHETEFKKLKVQQKIERALDKKFPAAYSQEVV
jgi:uncharacterized protein (DUF1697 family)